jgi:hypothetical protein
MKTATFHTCLTLGTLTALVMLVARAAPPESAPAPVATAKAAMLPARHEVIHTRGLLPALDQQVIAAGRVFGVHGQSLAVVSNHWMYAESADWVLLNGPRGTVTCPALLGPFGAANAPAEAMSLSTVRMLADRAAGGPIALSVMVPRFTAAPAGLSQCSGFSFDAKTGRLRAGGKYVAYLTPAQPLLAARTH